MDPFDDYEIMSNVIQKIKFAVEQIGDSMATNLVYSVFLKTHGIMEMAMVLDTDVNPPSQLGSASWISLVDHWRNHGVMNSFGWNLLLVDCLTNVMEINLLLLCTYHVYLFKVLI